MDKDEKYEYKILRDNVGGSGPIYEWMLNNLGEKGWELIHVSGNKERRFYLKRRIQ